MLANYLTHLTLSSEQNLSKDKARARWNNTEGDAPPVNPMADRRSRLMRGFSWTSHSKSNGYGSLSDGLDYAASSLLVGNTNTEDDVSLPSVPVESEATDGTEEEANVDGRSTESMSSGSVLSIFENANKSKKCTVEIELDPPSGDERDEKKAIRTKTIDLTPLEPADASSKKTPKRTANRRSRSSTRLGDNSDRRRIRASSQARLEKDGSTIRSRSRTSTRPTRSRSSSRLMENSSKDDASKPRRRTRTSSQPRLENGDTTPGVHTRRSKGRDGKKIRSTSSGRRLVSRQSSGRRLLETKEALSPFNGSKGKREGMQRSFNAKLSLNSAMKDRSTKDRSAPAETTGSPRSVIDASHKSLGNHTVGRTSSIRRLMDSQSESGLSIKAKPKRSSSSRSLAIGTNQRPKFEKPKRCSSSRSLKGVRRSSSADGAPVAPQRRCRKKRVHRTLSHD